MDVIMDFITDLSTMGILQKVAAAMLLSALSWVIGLIIKLTRLRKDMEALKLTIDEDKKQISRDKKIVREYMDITERYKDNTRDTIKQFETMVTQEKDAIMKIALAINSQLSSAQAHETLLGFGESADAETSEDVNAQILKDHLK
jgi:predicted histidine transporter YuiF (NhaC family)